MIFVGVDVSHSRGCAWAAINDANESIDAGWLQPGRNQEVCSSFLALTSALSRTDAITIGIDAPRQPIVSKRTQRWSVNRGWVTSAPMVGRHCEIVIANLRLANPQWTTLEADAKPWMRLGFDLFSCLDNRCRVLEVFPSASYCQLRDSREPRITLDFHAFANGPKDVIDAYVGAVTVAEFSAGRGCEVGGGDGLGTIVLPRPISPPDWRLLEWPTLRRDDTEMTLEVTPVTDNEAVPFEHLWVLKPVSEEERELFKIVDAAEVNSREANYANGIDECGSCRRGLMQCGLVVDGKRRDDLMWGNFCALCYLNVCEGIGWGRGQLYARQPNGDWRQVAGFEPINAE